MGRPPRYILKKEENIKPRATGKVLTPEQLFQNGKNFWYPIMSSTESASRVRTSTSFGSRTRVGEIPKSGS